MEDIPGELMPGETKRRSRRYSFIGLYSGGLNFQNYMDLLVLFHFDTYTIITATATTNNSITDTALEWKISLTALS